MLEIALHLEQPLEGLWVDFQEYVPKSTCTGLVHPIHYTHNPSIYRGGL